VGVVAAVFYAAVALRAFSRCVPFRKTETATPPQPVLQSHHRQQET